MDITTDYRLKTRQVASWLWLCRGVSQLKRLLLMFNCWQNQATNGQLYSINHLAEKQISHGPRHPNIFFWPSYTPLLNYRCYVVIRTKVRNKGKSKHSLSRSQTYTLIVVLGLLAACLLVIVASQEATEDPHYRGVSWPACSWPA